MSTPFELFRRHQKVALAAVTGVAVLSFLVNDVSTGQLSPFGIAILVIGCFSIVGWIWGAGEGKSGENAIFGGVLGLAITLVFMFLGRPPSAVSASSGNLSTRDLQDLSQRRMIANRMVNLVYYGANPNPGFMAQFQLPQLLFGFGSADPNDDVLISELLNREADALGIEITDAAALDFLKEVAGKDDQGKDRLTQRVFNDSIKNISSSVPGTSEISVIKALRQEMRARQTAKVLLGGDRTTPVDVWDIHRKLNTRQSAQFVSIPVEDFVDKNAAPADSELKDFFDTYKGNFPNSTATGEPEEGRPGLYLSRRVRLAYVEPNSEEIAKLVSEVTDAEIQQRYEERYQREMPNIDIRPQRGPVWPEVPLLPTVPKETTGQPAAEASTPSATDDKPAEPASPEAAPVATPPEPAPPEAATPEAAAPADDPANPPAADQPPAPEAKPQEMSRRAARLRLQTVALIQEEPAAAGNEPPATETAAPTPAEETPTEAPVPATPPSEEQATPEATPAAPAATEPPAPASETPAPTSEAPAAEPLSVPLLEGMDPDGDPVPPSTKVRPLDDELKQQIREELQAEKTRPLLEAKVNAARDFMNDLNVGVAEFLDHQNADKANQIELSADAMSPEVATQRLQDYAKKNGLIYTETPLMTLNDLVRSDDHPIGGAMVGRQGSVVAAVNRSQPTELFSATTAVGIELQTSYAYWKIEDIAAHEPQSLDEPGVKDMAIKALRSMKARASAEKRAQDLADIARKSDKPMAESLGEQSVTGEKDNALFVTVKSTGDFSWLQRSLTPQRFGGDNAPRLGAILGVEGAGDSFMAKVFNEIKPGETAVVPNFDRTIYYVFRVEQRFPSTEAEVAVLRRQFLESQGDLSVYASQQSRSRDGSFADRLFRMHGVKQLKSRNNNAE